jgi:hypothetical protein
MGNSDVGFPPGRILFMVFEYIYMALLVMSFVLYIPTQDPLISDLWAIVRKDLNSRMR